MNFSILVSSSSVSFKRWQKLSTPTLFVASGLSGDEDIIVQSLIVIPDDQDPNAVLDDDNSWVNLTDSEVDYAINAATNSIFIQAPGYYRFVLAEAPATAVTLAMSKY